MTLTPGGLGRTETIKAFAQRRDWKLAYCARGGGTAFEPVFIWMRDQRGRRFDGLVYLRDSEGRQILLE